MDSNQSASNRADTNISAATYLCALPDACDLAVSCFAHVWVFRRETSNEQADDVTPEDFHPAQQRGRGTLHKHLRTQRDHHQWVIHRVIRGALPDASLLL